MQQSLRNLSSFATNFLRCPLKIFFPQRDEKREEGSRGQRKSSTHHHALLAWSDKFPSLLPLSSGGVRGEVGSSFGYIENLLWPPVGYFPSPLGTTLNKEEALTGTFWGYRRNWRFVQSTCLGRFSKQWSSAEPKIDNTDHPNILQVQYWLDAVGRTGGGHGSREKVLLPWSRVVKSCLLPLGLIWLVINLFMMGIGYNIWCCGHNVVDGVYHSLQLTWGGEQVQFPNPSHRPLDTDVLFAVLGSKRPRIPTIEDAADMTFAPYNYSHAEMPQADARVILWLDLLWLWQVRHTTIFFVQIIWSFHCWVLDYYTSSMDSGTIGDVLVTLLPRRGGSTQRESLSELWLGGVLGAY